MGSTQQHTLSAVLAATVEISGDQVAMTDGDRNWTYSELSIEAHRVARALIATGVVGGQRIAIWSPNVAEWVLTAIGLQLIGAVLVPLNTRLQSNEAIDILDRSGASFLFAWSQLEKGSVTDMVQLSARTDLKEIQFFDDGSTWAEFIARGDAITELELDRRVAAVKPSDVMDMLFTSGTTGKPKGVLCTHEQNIRAFTAWSSTVGLRTDDKYLIINPFFHSFGYKAGWLAALLVGCEIIPVFSFDQERVMALIEEQKITMLPGAPSLYQMILSHPRRKDFDLSSLRLGVTGAAAVPVALVEAMRNELGFETVVTAYGLTETCGVVSICRPDDDAETIANTSGRAIEGVELKCANPDTGEELARGMEGEIWVRGYNVMLGYFDMPEATAETITTDGWLRTGDIGVMDERGYLRITDRLKDMYIMNGENVYPAEVEKTIFSLSGVSQVAVIGVAKAPQGEVGMAFVVASQGQTLNAEQIKHWCGQYLASYKIPFYVRLVDSLPINASGKVVKPELRLLATQLLSAKENDIV
ncbi:MAG: FadD3 family acyl-CoA ligase [Pseudomonadales bacterium]